VAGGLVDSRGREERFFCTEIADDAAVGDRRIADATAVCRIAFGYRLRSMAVRSFRSYLFGPRGPPPRQTAEEREGGSEAGRRALRGLGARKGGNGHLSLFERLVTCCLSLAYEPFEGLVACCLYLASHDALRLLPCCERRPTRDSGNAKEAAVLVFVFLGYRRGRAE